ncbi:MAG: response regulator transcription factor [Rhodanobacteraceae bacterium]
MLGKETPAGFKVESLECTFNLDEFPVAALLCQVRDTRCIAVNRRFEQLVGNARAEMTGCAIDDLVIASRDNGGLPADRGVLLRRHDGTTVAMTRVSLPVIHGGAHASLHLFLERRLQGWRNVDLAFAIDAVIRDDMQWFSGAVMERLARLRSSTAGSGLEHLTTRERQVLKRVCEGRDDAHIAAELGISRNTLRNHLSNIYGKADVRRRSEVVVWGRERGITAF